MSCCTRPIWPGERNRPAWWHTVQQDDDERLAYQVVAGRQPRPTNLPRRCTNFESGSSARSANSTASRSLNSVAIGDHRPGPPTNKGSPWGLPRSWPIWRRHKFFVHRPTCRAGSRRHQSSSPAASSQGNLAKTSMAFFAASTLPNLVASALAANRCSSETSVDFALPCDPAEPERLVCRVRR